MPEHTDEEIAKLVQGGDVESFGLLMERYQGKITRYARKFLFHGEVQDLVQEVFIKPLAQSSRFFTWFPR